MFVYTGRVHGRVHGPSAVVYMAGRSIGPCTRSQTARYGRVRPITAVYTARSYAVHGSVYGRVRRPLDGRPTRAYVYTAVKRPCTRHIHGRVHGQYTAVYTGHVHGRVHGPSCTWQVGLSGHVHVPRRPCTRPCNVSCIRPCTSRIASCTRQYTGRVHGRFRACTPAVYTAVFGHLHSAYTAGVHGRVTARVLGRYTAVYKGRLGRVGRQVGLPTGPCTRSQTAHYGHVRPVTAYGPCMRPCTRPV